MRYGHQSRFPRLMHPRREAGPQSHGTPTEFAGLPTNAPPGRSPSLRMGGPWRPQERRRGCSPTSEDVPCPALPPSSAPASPSPRASPSRPYRSPPRPPRSISPPPDPSWSWAVPPSPTPARRCSTAISGSLPEPPSWASGCPAVVNGATHANDAVARQAQADLTTAYDVAAGQAVTRDLTGTDLGGQALSAGAYRYASSAQLTGTVTLDAQGDPNAQFVFMIGSTLTTASDSSVVLINGASPCNVYWQVGSSATIGTTTAFQGNVLALTSISVNNGASVIGRTLARNGAVTLDNNVLSNSQCAAGTTSPTPPPTPPRPARPRRRPPTPPRAPRAPRRPPRPARAAQHPRLPPRPPRAARHPRPPPRPPRHPRARRGRPTPTSPARSPRSRRAARDPRRRLRPMGRPRSPPSPGRATVGPSCTAGFRATVRGRGIKQVVFSLDGKRIASRARSPFKVYVRLPGPAQGHRSRHVQGRHPPRVLTLGYRPCAAQLRRAAARRASRDEPHDTQPRRTFATRRPTSAAICATGIRADAQQINARSRLASDAALRDKA